MPLKRTLTVHGGCPHVSELGGGMVNEAPEALVALPVAGAGAVISGGPWTTTVVGEVAVAPVLSVMVYTRGVVPTGRGMLWPGRYVVLPMVTVTLQGGELQDLDSSGGMVNVVPLGLVVLTVWGDGAVMAGGLRRYQCGTRRRSVKSRSKHHLERPPQWPIQKRLKTAAFRAEKICICQNGHCPFMYVKEAQTCISVPACTCMEQLLGAFMYLHAPQDKIHVNAGMLMD